MVRSETSSCSANWAAVSRPRAWSRSSSETSRDARILVLLSRACEGSLLIAICHPERSEGSLCAHVIPSLRGDLGATRFILSEAKDLLLNRDPSATPQDEATSRPL